ncbi:MAG: PKD domain-containing protein [Ardenticatenaceae bacterium]|nr:PKD domain-containing protein [Ardenticatenaceae bacterium]
MKRIYWISGLLMALLAITFLSWQQVTAQSSAPEYVVVRIHYSDQQTLNDLASWKEPWQVNAEAGYLIVEATRQEIADLRAAGLYVELDAALTAAINTPPVIDPLQGGGIPGYSCYRTVEETFTSAEEMVANYPTLATWTDIGDSWDKVTPGGPAGYDMNVLRLTNAAITGPKPKLLILGSIHAREYTAAEMATRFAEYLLANYGVDPDVTWLLDYHEIHLVLQANPDGRKTAEAGQLWRKNRNNGDGCASSFGVDLNRNFEFYWNSGGSSSNSCSETYHGSSAASEPETQVIQAYEQAIFLDQRDSPITATAPLTTTGIFIDLHSYAREILWPWGFTASPPPNGAGMQTLARKMGFFNNYDATQSLYATSGTTKDYAYGEFGVPAYTIEMGTAFFQSCTYFESTLVPEMMPTLLYAAKAARFSYITPAGPDVVGLDLSAAVVLPGTTVTLTAAMNDTRYNNSQGTEPSQAIAAAEYYVDVPPWVTTTVPISVPLTAVDGTFNSPIEAVIGTVDTTGWSDGQYTLFVRGQDAAGNWGAISAIFLTVSSEVPTAAFSHPSPIATGQTISFTNSSTGTNLMYAWDFGDGTTSSAAQPSHSYSQAMSYTVTLTVANGVATDTASSVVVVMDAATAVFSHPSPVATHAVVTFTNQSTGTDVSYSWAFGDGDSSSDIQPSHAFTQANTYTVTLAVANEISSDSSSSLITVMDPPVADFVVTNVITAGTAVTFTNLSTGTDISYTWDFGDGSGSSDIEPTHIFTQPGQITVTLTVANAVGVDVATAVIQVIEVIPPSFHSYLPFIRAD